MAQRNYQLKNEDFLPLAIPDLRKTLNKRNYNWKPSSNGPCRSPLTSDVTVSENFAPQMASFLYWLTVCTSVQSCKIVFQPFLFAVLRKSGGKGKQDSVAKSISFSLFLIPFLNFRFEFSYRVCTIRHFCFIFSTVY